MSTSLISEKVHAEHFDVLIAFLCHHTYTSYKRLKWCGLFGLSCDQGRVMSDRVTTEDGVSATTLNYVSVHAVFKELDVNTVSSRPLTLTTLSIVQSIYGKKPLNPQKIATKGFSTDSVRFSCTL